MHPRFVEDRIRLALSDTPVVAVSGPRQAGKTTLVTTIADEGRRYLTLDDQTVLAGAKSDPAGFLRGLDRAVIDEIQRAPELMLALKQSVDADRRPGRFLITGSANLLTMTTAQESLAGRIEIINLLPLAQAEIRETGEPSFLSDVFEGKAPRIQKQGSTGDTLLRAVLSGGYPEVLARENSRRRVAWCRQYLDAIVQRDLNDLVSTYKPTEVRLLVDALALQVGQLTNFSQLGGQLGLNDKTVATYVGLLEQLFVVRRLPAWHRNAMKRLLKTPKVHFLDTGLVAASSNMTAEKVAANRKAYGALLEGFVFAELLKLANWSQMSIRISHFRDKDQVEVDFVLEDDKAGLVGVEVKAGATVLSDDFKGLRKLQSITGDDFRLGVVLYDGDEAVPFGDRLWAAPVSALWAS